MEREERGRMEIVVVVVVCECEDDDNWMVESDGVAARRDDGCGGGRSVAAALFWQAAVKVLKRCSMVVVLW